MPIYEYQGQRYEMAEEDPLKAKSRILSYLNKSESETPKERTYGEAAQDIGAGLLTGIGGIAALPSQIGRLAGAEGALPLEESSKRLQEYAQSLKSEALKQREKNRDKLVEEASKAGVLNEMWAAFKETGKDPALFTSFLAEQLPMLIPGGIAGRAVKLAGAGAKAALATDLGVNAVMQGADVGSGAYDEAYKYLVDKGMKPEEAKKEALSIARKAAVSSGVISAVAQKLPGAQELEKTVLGIKGTGGRLAGATTAALGEAGSEIVEEGGGQMAKNIALQQANPDQNIMQGVGQAAGLAALGGSTMGGASGLLRGQEPQVTAPPVPNEEKIAEAAATSDPDKLAALAKEVQDIVDIDPTKTPAVPPAAPTAQAGTIPVPTKVMPGSIEEANRLAQVAADEQKENNAVAQFEPIKSVIDLAPEDKKASLKELTPELLQQRAIEAVNEMRATNKPDYFRLKPYFNVLGIEMPKGEGAAVKALDILDNYLRTKGEENVGRDDSTGAGTSDVVSTQTGDINAPTEFKVDQAGGLGADLSTEKMPGVGETTEPSTLTNQQIEDLGEPDVPTPAPTATPTAPTATPTAPTATPTAPKTLSAVALEAKKTKEQNELDEKEALENLVKYSPKTQQEEIKRAQAIRSQQALFAKEISKDTSYTSEEIDQEIAANNYFVAAEGDVKKSLELLAIDLYTKDKVPNPFLPNTGGDFAKNYFKILSKEEKDSVEARVKELEKIEKRLKKTSSKEAIDKKLKQNADYQEELTKDVFSAGELNLLKEQNKKTIKKNKEEYKKSKIDKLELSELQGGATKDFIGAVFRGDTRGALREIVEDTTGQFTKLDKVIAKRLLFSKSLPSLRVVKNLKHDGAYNAETDIAYIKESSVNSHVFLHETLHGFTASFIRFNEDHPAVRDLQKLFDFVLKNNPELGSEYGFKNLVEFVSEVFSNRDLQVKLDKIPYRRGSAFVDFAKEILRILNIAVNDTYSVLAQALISTETILDEGRKYQDTNQFRLTGDTNIYDLASAPEEIKTPKSEAEKKAAHAAENLTDVTLESNAEQLKEAGYKLGDKEKPKTIAEGVKFFGNRQGRERFVQLFQNRSYPLLTWQNDNNASGFTKYGEEDINNIADWLTLATQKAKTFYMQEIQPHYESLQVNLSALSKALGKSTEDTLVYMTLVMEGLHEPERRMLKYLLSVPLTAEANAVRARIVQFLDSKNELSKEQIKMLRDKLNQIVFETDANGNIVYDAKGDPKPNTKFVNEYGYAKNKSEKTKQPVEFDSIYYNVIGVEPTAIKKRIEQYNNSPHKAEIDKVLADVKALNNGVVNLNKESNYFSNPVSNRVNFYGFEHYAPFKGKNSFKTDSEVDVDLDQLEKISRTLQTTELSMDGRVTRSNNPILQILSEGASASARAGRGEKFTQSIKNSVQKSEKLNPNGQDLINGKVVDHIEFVDKDYSKIEKYKSNEKAIFHYNKDGSIDIIEIYDIPLVKSIKGTYKHNSTALEMANKVTSTLGQFHTRYNLKFAPLNFVRDILTNAWAIGADMGPAKAAKFIGIVTSQMILNNSMGKAYKIAKLYGKGNIAAIKALKDKDGYKEMVEYIEQGGMVEYMQSLSLKSNFQQLNKELGRNKILKGIDQIEGFLDSWTNMFEIASRSAAYKVIKQEYMNNNTAEKNAATKAATYVKNLANFEQVGEWGKTMGALYMFFRPSATGAIRAIEAISPAFRNTDAVMSELPAYITSNEQAKAEFKKDFLKKKLNAQIMTAALIGLGMTMYTMSRLSAPDDDEGRNEIDTDNIDLWTRFARFVIPKEILGTEKNVTFQLPWGFGLGAFAAMGAQIAAAASGNTTAGHAFFNIVTQISLDSFVPLPVSRMDATEHPMTWFVDSLVPSAGRPLVEYVMNRNGLGHEIKNDAASRKMGDAYTGGDNVPEIYKDAAAYFAKSTLGFLNISPNELYFFANSYIDGISVLAEQAYGINDLISGEKNFNPKTDIFLLNSFIGTKSSIDSREFAKVSKQIERIGTELSMFKKASPETYLSYIEKNPFAEAVVESYNKQVNGTLRDLRADANQIRDRGNGYDQATRKDLLDVNLMYQNIIKRNMIEEFKAYDITP